VSFSALFNAAAVGTQVHIQGHSLLDHSSRVTLNGDVSDRKLLLTTQRDEGRIKGLRDLWGRVKY